MNILDRYIAKTVLMSIGMVTLMLVGLQIFILFVDQLGDLGRVDYGIMQAAFLFYCKCLIKFIYFFLWPVY